MSTPLTTKFGPCDVWPILWTCDVSCESPAVTARAAQISTEVLWALSGRQFGLCTVTLRPCRKDCTDFESWPLGWYDVMPGTGLWPMPALIGGQWFNLVCGSCGDNCSCSRISEIELPTVVHDIVQVKVDGITLAPTAYRLDNDRFLVRVDGNEWPRCNDLNHDDTEIGTWSVTARYGQDVPEGGAWAMGELACQFIGALNGQDCRLPASVTQLVRQGVTIQMDNVTELLKTGLTGLYLVDMFIATWNPGKLKRRARTYSVDGPISRRAGS